MTFLIRETVSEGKPRLHYYLVKPEGGSLKVFKASLSVSELNDVLLSKADVDYRRTRKTVSTESERLFKMAVIYGGVRLTLRNTSYSRLLALAKALLSLEEFSLQFWYTEFVSRYSQTNNLVDTYRVGKAFRDLYGV